MVSKYGPLERHLCGSPGLELTLSFSEIEEIIGSPLAPSAHQQRAWWANTRSHVQATAWLTAGHEVDAVQLGQWVRFRRVGSGCAGDTPPGPPQRHTAPRAVPPQPATPTPSYDDLPQPPCQDETLVLVSCVKTKRAIACHVRDLYTSTWFRKAKAYVERMGIPWLILSAEHGLVHPDQLLEPYERRLKDMGAQQRREWARRVMDQFHVLAPRVRRCVILAGQGYREFLVPRLETSGVSIEIPLEGLTQGRQLSWLSEH